MSENTNCSFGPIKNNYETPTKYNKLSINPFNIKNEKDQLEKMKQIISKKIESLNNKPKNIEKAIGAAEDYAKTQHVYPQKKGNISKALLQILTNEEKLSKRNSSIGKKCLGRPLQIINEKENRIGFQRPQGNKRQAHALNIIKQNNNNMKVY